MAQHAREAARSQAQGIDAALRRLLRSGFPLDQIVIEWHRDGVGFEPRVTLRAEVEDQAGRMARRNRERGQEGTTCR